MTSLAIHFFKNMMWKDRNATGLMGIDFLYTRNTTKPEIQIQKRMPQMTPYSVSTLTIYILCLSWTKAFLTGFRFHYFTQSYLEQQPAWGPGTTPKIKKTLLIEQTHLLYTHRFNYFLVVSFQFASKAIPIWNTKQHWKLFRGYHFSNIELPTNAILGPTSGRGPYK